MNKLILSLILLVTVFLFSGCVGGGDSGNSLSSYGGDSDKGSSQGVVVKFDANNPPSEMFKGKPYSFVLLFSNYLKEDVTDLKVKPSGFEVGYVKGMNVEQYSLKPEVVSKMRLDNPGISRLIFPEVRVDDFEGDYLFNPKFDYCYTGKTSFLKSVCVKSKAYEDCQKITNKESVNGVVGVKMDRIDVIEDKVRVEFTVLDKNKNVVNECFSSEKDYMFEYKILGDVMLGTSKGDCYSLISDEFAIMNGEGKFYCEFSRSQDGAYSTQVVLNIEYKYQESISKSVNVIDPSERFN